ncbi:MAG: RNA polymerase sigma factor [Phycisphaerae bacterium]|nr:RNA polymerase sigma factor [Phycisphaerae bacterium]
MQQDDTPLLLAAGQGDRAAFGRLVERYHRAVIHFLQRFLTSQDADEAEDLAQDVFLAAWKAAPTFEPRAKVLTWLLRIATNAALNYRRDRQKRRAVSLDGTAPPTSDIESPVGRALSHETRETVTAALAALPPTQRAALILRHYHQLPYAEIAAVLETSISAVESLLFRARQSLQKSLACHKSESPPQVSPGPRVQP